MWVVRFSIAVFEADPHAQVFDPIGLKSSNLHRALALVRFNITGFEFNPHGRCCDILHAWLVAVVHLQSQL